MANSYAVDYKKRHVTLPAKLTEVATNGGRMRVLYDTYTTASNVDGDLIYFGKLPGGAKVWEASLYVSATAGSGITADLGYASTASTDVDAFLDGVDIHVATTGYFMAGGADTDSGNKNNKSNAPVSIPNEVDITVKVLGGNPGDGKVWQVQIWYTVD
tara:strand:- start:1756 stop:2229 length:474 start_codon:yes stop_codon:yes gene_type:complete